MLDGPRPQEETQSYIAQFPQWFKLSIYCRKNTALGLCAQNMPLDFKIIYHFCAFNNYKYDKSSKNTTIYSLFSATSLKGHNQFEHKIKRIYIYICVCIYTYIYI
jgi:hypothetical protein